MPRTTFLSYCLNLLSYTLVGLGLPVAEASDFKVETSEVAIPLVVRPLTEVFQKDLIVHVDKREVSKTIVPLSLPWEVDLVLDVSGSMLSLVRREDFRKKFDAVIQRLVASGLSNMSINVYTSDNNLNPYLTHVSPIDFKFPHVYSGGNTSIMRDILNLSRNPLDQKFAGRIVVAVTDGVDYNFRNVDQTQAVGAFQGNSFLLFVDLSRLPDCKAFEKYLKQREKNQFGKVRDNRTETAERRSAFINLVSLSYGDYVYPDSEENMIPLLTESMAKILSASHMLFINQNEFNTKATASISIQAKKNSSIRMIQPLRKSVRLGEVQGDTQRYEVNVDWESEIDLEFSPPTQGALAHTKKSTVDLSVMSKNTDWRNNQPILEFHPQIIVERNSKWFETLPGKTQTHLEFELLRTAKTLSACNIAMSSAHLTVSESQLFPVGIPRAEGDLKKSVQQLQQQYPDLAAPAIYYSADPTGSSVMGVTVRSTKPKAPKEGWIFISDSSLEIYRRIIRQKNHSGTADALAWAQGGFTTLHEFGHLYGSLAHTVGDNIMAASASGVNNQISKEQCEALRNGIPKASNR